MRERLMLAVAMPLAFAEPASSEAGRTLRIINVGPHEKLMVYEVPGGLGGRQHMPEGTNIVIAETCQIVLGFHFPWCRVRSGGVTGWVNSYYLSGE